MNTRRPNLQKNTFRINNKGPGRVNVRLWLSPASTLLQATLSRPTPGRRPSYNTPIFGGASLGAHPTGSSGGEVHSGAKAGTGREGRRGKEREVERQRRRVPVIEEMSGWRKIKEVRSV